MSRIEEALNKAARASFQEPERENAAPFHDVPVDPSRFTYDRLVAVKTPESSEAEQFRKLKESLFGVIHSQNPQNVFLITSPNQGDGKSLVAVNLAVTLAKEHDHTVLLMDADLRKPACHKYLDITPQTGLSECLRGENDVEAAIINTGVGKLSLLPAGKPVRNPLELFTSQTMNRLIQELKHRYKNRIILIDTPPVLLFAETRTLNGLADSALLVIREGKSSLEDTKETITLLGNKVSGLVYNAAQSPLPSSYSYYHDYYAKEH